jgi:heparanase
MTRLASERPGQAGGLRVVLLILGVTCSISAQSVPLAPATMPRIGTVDERFQSYNIEMVEVTGGRFWKPYESGPGASDKAHAPAKPTESSPAGIDPALFEYRPPIDLSNARLRKLAAGLGPAYIRVSGTWANTVYFHDSDDPAPEKPPAGFNAVLTRKQWKGVVDFSRAVDGKIMTSFSFGTGARDAAGVWTPEQARKWLGYTKAVGGSIAAAEFMNEPNFASIGGAPKGYDAAGFARDLAVFRSFLKESAPGIFLLGPSSVGEAGVLATSTAIPGRLRTEDLMKATGPVFDGFSYHIYPAVSQRCAATMPSIGTTAAVALSKDWLSRPGEINEFYMGLRDKYDPGKPLWVTETADAACGGNPWASTFLDTFRYLNQHGRLAQKGVQVIAHNTLAASDYGLLDEKTFAPRPNYWASVLWRRLMGPVVLTPGPAPDNDLYVYAHCMRDRRGGVTVLAINAGAKPQEVEAPLSGKRYTLTAKQVEGTAVQLNGRELQAASDGALPPLEATSVRAGRLSLTPASITFLAFPDAGNKACQ